MLGKRSGIWVVATWAIVSAVWPARAVEPVTSEPFTAVEVQRYTDLDVKKIQELTNEDLADYVRLRARDLALRPERPRPGDEIGHYAMQALGQPYRIKSWRHDLTEVDCVTFQERCIALALAVDWRSYHLLTDRIRHKDGDARFAARNVYPLADWVPSNAWLFEDVTAKLGVPAATFDLEVERRKRALADIRAGYVAPAEVNVETVPEVEWLSQTYVASEHIYDALPALRTGDLAFVIHARRLPGRPLKQFCDHVGILVRDESDLVTFVHAAPPQVRQEYMLNFLERCPWVSGFKFLRLRDNARELVTAELERTGAGKSVPAPADQDSTNRTLRQSRGLELRAVDKQ
ncbi:MAG: DUF1460 domain-containing protein [Phycisphaerae bacterium]|nr:DUF1460 domain-containing protein [Phycisphaerae bacterium]